MESKGAQLRKKKKQELVKLDDIQKYIESPYTTPGQMKSSEKIKTQIQERIASLSRDITEWENSK